MADVRKKPLYKGQTVRLPRHGHVPTPDLGPHDDAADDEVVDADVPPTEASPVHRAAFGRDDESAMEVVIVREDATPRRARQTWRAIEVWTKNRVYGMDSQLVCFEVVDRKTGKLDPQHPMVGGKLGGGRRRSGKSALYTHPLPLPGTEAMFMCARRQGYTSPVERVVLRIRALRVRNGTTWEQLLDQPEED